MPGAVSPDSLVLLTGASGFLAIHLGKQLLEAGYKVRGTVRSVAKGEYLDGVFAKAGIADKWSWVVVEDVETPEAFNEAVKGVDAIAHTASPFHYRVTDPYLDLINPAVNGTLNILNSALNEPKVQRIVITSSNAAITDPSIEPVYVFTEKDWNEYSTKQVEELGAEVPPGHAYRASKTLAEKAAWEFLEEKIKHGSDPWRKYDIVTINPPLIFGPVLHEIPTASSLNTSVGMFYQYLIGAKTNESAVDGAGSYVDVRDVAKLHVLALSTPEASNKRFAASSGSMYYQKALDILHRPENESLLAKFPKCLPGVPGAPEPVQNKLSGALAQETFGWVPIPFVQTIVDMAESLAERQKDW